MLRSFLMVFSLLFLASCGEKQDADTLVVAVSLDYPPFEFVENGHGAGFDIDLAHAIGKELGKKIEIKDMKFTGILASIKTGQADMGISSLTVTDERQKNFDFSTPYYTGDVALVFHKKRPLMEQDLAEKKVGCQMGTVFEYWVKKNAPQAEAIFFDLNPSAIEALRVHHIDAVVMDKLQAEAFLQKNRELEMKDLGSSGEGFAVMVKKGSSLKAKVDAALDKMLADGQIDKLKHKWLSGPLDKVQK